MKNIKIISFKNTTIFSIVVLATFVSALALMLFFEIYNRVYSQDMGCEWFLTKEGLVLTASFLLSVYLVSYLTLLFKMNVYSIIMEEDGFIYKFIRKQAIPYSGIKRMQLIEYRARGGTVVHALKLFLNNKRIIRLRLDHLDINRLDDIIKARLPYLEVHSNEDLVLDFLKEKTGQSIEQKNGDLFL